jgi:hypothetical protein
LQRIGNLCAGSVKRQLNLLIFVTAFTRINEHRNRKELR